MEIQSKTAKIVEISGTLDHPDLSIYKSLRKPVEHFVQRIFVGEGENVVRRLLASTLKIRTLLLTPEWYDAIKDEPRLHEDGVIIYRAPRELVEEIVGFNLHQGIMAVAEMPEDPTLEAVLARVGQTGLIVALDGLVSAENVGVVVRNCAGLGADLVISGEKAGSPYLRRAVRNSMGTVFTMPVIHVPSLANCLTMLRKQHQYDILAADPLGSKTLYATKLTGKVCIVVGNEGNGLSPEILPLCNLHVSIPMERQTDSLNVANATAVILSEALRQRKYDYKE